ncbi:MAG: PIG-L family deacetylase [Gammaproteobacteria bacterium]|nr:PIG-L family deacetylase [Gammaproteobacteria bacterium]
MATMVNFHAHPDDEAIATSGTMMKAADEGHRVVLVVATKGEQGEPVPGALSPGETLGERRAAETLEAAKIIGAHRVEFLGYEDSGMAGEGSNNNPASFWQADFDEAVERLARILAEESADVLTVYDDHGGYGHPDHIQVHRVGVGAARKAGVERVFYATMNRTQILRQMAEVESFAEAMEDIDVEGAERIRDEEFGTEEADITHAVDVSAYLERKRVAMLAHASQITADSFFGAMTDEQFADAFGTEWFVAPGPPRTGDFATDLFG